MPTRSDRSDADPAGRPRIDPRPPTRSKVSAGLAAVACAISCSIPLLITAGVITGAGAVLVQQTLVGLAAALVTAALAMWWLHRRRAQHHARGERAGTAARPQ